MASIYTYSYMLQGRRKMVKSGWANLLKRKYFYGAKLKSYGAPLKSSGEAAP